jgi:hypothetical protein
MMRRVTVGGLATLLTVLVSASSAWATDVWVTSTIMTFGQNAQSDANEIQVPQNVNVNCDIGPNARAYIRKENKHIYAAALSASMQSKTVSVGIKTDSDPMNIYGSLPSPLTCEVFSILVKP